MTNIFDGIKRAFTDDIEDALLRRFRPPLGHPFLLTRRISTVEKLLEAWITDRAAVERALDNLPHQATPTVVVQRLGCLVAPLSCLTGSALTLDASARGSAVLGVSSMDEGLLQSAGLPAGTITEIAGEAGTGKTHLAIHVALASVVSAVQRNIQRATVPAQCSQTSLSAVDLVLPTGGATALYIAAEAVPHQRLWDLAEHFAQRLNHWLAESSAAAAARAAIHDTPGMDWRLVTRSDLLDRVLVRKIDAGTLLSTLDDVTTLVRSRGRSELRVVIIDSIAAALAEDEARGLKSHRTECRIPASTWNVGARLKLLASELHVAIVAVNQVRSNFEKELVPALGSPWAHCVTTRIHLFHNKTTQRDAAPSGTTKTAVLAMSAYLPSAAVAYRIMERGLVVISPDEA